MKAPITRAFREASTPLLWYYAIAVVVPLLNGAASRDTLFFEHTAFVLLVPVVLVTVVGLLIVFSKGALRRAPLNPRSLRGSGSRFARSCGFGIKDGPR
jgi:hypothetical protein